MGARGQAAAGRLQKDIGKLGATQREEGQRLVAAAQRGELTAPQQQQLEAFRAQQAQALSSRGISGGTAAQQLDAQIENMRQQLLQQNLQTGLALLQVGDQYTQQAITAGYNADQTAQNTAGRFYGAALQAIGAIPGQGIQTKGAT
jgi:K+-sensing histidine kinase KdpD